MLSHLMNEEKIIEVYGFTYSKLYDGSLKIYILLESLNAKGDLYDFLREPLYWEESDGERYFSMSEKKKREICSPYGNPFMNININIYRLEGHGYFMNILNYR